ncbi:MAG TPA: hypothetical protein VFK02_15715 [Kofleriaceae bacterium]|nr:hypothetical protein [Kofleriaceae bacterium]
MTNDSEPRALGAALSAPAFVTRGHGVAMHAANRHVERWAPEASAGRVRSMRSLGFVDRLVAPWIETAQRSASMRVFNQYVQTGASEREPGAVSWVFPRPWYQDELDWMAAARRTSAQAAATRQPAPTLLTTRGTYMAPARPEIAAPQVAMPSALYEFVAPSLSLAAGQPAPVAGTGYGGDTLARGEAYSPLVSLAAVHAAELMSRTVAPLAAQTGGVPTAMTPGLRTVLTSILERAAMPASEPSRISMAAPELVTPPAPRPDVLLAGEAGGPGSSAAMGSASMASSAAATSPAAPASSIPSVASMSAAAAAATQVAEQYAAQRARIAELSRIAQQAAQRELAARAEARPAPAGDAAQAEALAQAARSAAAARTAQGGESPSGTSAQTAAAQAAAAQAAAAQAAAQATSTTEVRAAAERVEAELRQRTAAARGTETQRQAEALAERARMEERVAQRMAQHAAAQRLHEQARAEAAAHARRPLAPARTEAEAATRAPVQLSAEVTAAIAALPPELAAIVGSAVAQRPDRAMQIISSLQETLRTAELLARSSASGVAFESVRGPRTVMPAGLGGLVTAVDRANALADRPAMLAGRRPIAAQAAVIDPGAQPGPLAVEHALAFAQAHARAQAQAQAAAAAARSVRVPALAWLAGAPRSQGVAGSVTALGATTAVTPAALSHVAWSDRWLARFAGATSQSLDLITATAGAAPAVRMQALANAAPGAVFVAPDFLRGDLAAEQAARGAGARPSGGRGSLGDAAGAGAIAAGGPAAATGQGPAAGVPGMRLINPPSPEIRRFADDEETPDDVFAAISQAAARGRGRGPARPGAPDAASARPATPGGATQVGRPVAGAPGAPAGERQTYADLVAHSAPSAPGAGMSAHLASSPFAPALRHMLPLPAAASFDVRALFGAGLGATYLAGLLGAASHELHIGAHAAPTWASWDLAPIGRGAQLGQLGQAGESGERIDRLPPRLASGFDPAYVSPEAYLGADAQGDAAAMAEARAALEATASGELRAAVEAQAALERATVEAGREAEAMAEARGATARGAGDVAGAGEAPASELAAAIAAQTERGANIQLTTLRSALLSWGLTITDDTAAQPGVPQLAPMAFATSAATGAGEPTLSTSAARMMIDAMTLPMLSQLDAEPASAWAAPGMVAERAQSWSVAQERSSSDLALDFVTPELVLAARVYGLGPAEAAQAARLAVVGAGQLGAMASTVDRTFVEAMAIVRDARTSDGERRQRISSAGQAGAAAADEVPEAGDARDARVREAVSRGGVPGTVAAGEHGEVAGAPARAAITTAFPTADGGVAAALAPTTREPAPLPSGVAFGVGRRSPRGAFLWPQATVAALGLHAAGSDGQLSMSVAALELLAAQVVAEVGTYAALSEADGGARALAGQAGLDGSVPGSAGGAISGSAPGAVAGFAESVAGSGDATGAVRPVLPDGSPARAPAFAAGTPGALASGRGAGAAPGAEPGEAEVLGAAAALIPAARRARFDALYVALGQTAAGRSWSPAARAARALALAGRGDDATITARERAATAWDVLPVVYGGAGAVEASSDATGAAAAAAAIMSSSYVAPGMPGFAGAAAIPGDAPSLGGAGRGAAWTPGAGSPGAAVAGLASGARASGAGASRDLVAPSGGESGGLDRIVVSSSPGLAGLSARAGDALGAYVAPAAPPAAPRERRETTSAGAVLRPPSAAPEYVQTGRSGGRYGGSEVEIPPWFESAARRLLADRGDGDGISLAELTLVTAAPASHIAASSRTAPSASPPAPTGPSGAGQSPNAPQIDIDKLANDIYRQILVMMDAARARNGEPYL